MDALPSHLRRALEADDAEDLGLLLQQRSAQDFDALRTLLSPDLSVPANFRSKAIHALGLWGDPVVVPEIAQLTPQLDERGRMSALGALGRLGTPAAEAVVAAYVDDPSPQVRKMAVWALGQSPTPEANRKLREVASTDPVEWVREAAARSTR